MDQPYGGIRLDIPTINDDPGDFDRLFGLWQVVNDSCGDVTFDFTPCRFLRPNAIAFLGGLARLIQSQNRSGTFDWETVSDPVLAILRQNGFAGAFGYIHTLGGPGSSIPYREDRTYATGVENDIINYLKFNWLGTGWVRVTSRLRDAIVGRVWEIYANAFLHAKSNIGVFSCGQYFWQMHVLKLAVVDFGVGITTSVKQYFKETHSAEELDAAVCLEWAFRERTSTIKGVGRGNGLSLLKEFVNINHGRLEVYSQDGYALIEGGKEKFNNRRKYFQGTLVNITLRCDKKYYQLVDEGPSGPLF